MAKNLGQIAGLFVGSSAPTNTTLIWYDTASHVHKVYNTSLAAWTVLDQQSISAITYSELVNRAGTTGLTQGQWFKITDRSNALALAITSTKVQYADNSGALIVNDLGTSISYHITSGNLLIDDINGVYNTTTGKLVFSFAEDTPMMSDGDENVDYIMGQSKRGVNKSLKKWRMSRFLSSDSNNALSWSGGFFLNFAAKLRTFFDVEGGVTSKQTFDNFQQTQQQTIQQLAQNELNAIQQVGNAIAQEVTPAKIYDKALPTAPTSGTPIDIAQGDKLGVIVNKIQRWITKFKKADGIDMPANYTPAQSAQQVNNNDSVSSAIGKLAYLVNHVTGERIDDGSINTDDLANLAVATAKLANLAVTAAKLADNAVTVNKLHNKSVNQHKLAWGVQPTDVCRLDIEVSFPSGSTSEAYILNNMSVGFNLGCGTAGLFAYDSTDANNPYRLSNYASPYDCPIISFANVIAPQNNTEHDFSIAAPMLHYKGHYIGSATTMSGMYFQSQILLSQMLYDALYNLGMRYVRVTILSVDVYDNTSIVVAPIDIEMHRVNIWGFPVTLEQLTIGGGYHMVVKIQISFVASI